MTVCSECGKSLRGKPSSAKTCGPNCRSKRARRIKRKRVADVQNAAIANSYSPEQREIRAMAQAQQDVVRDVLREEVTPIVREALTDEVLVGIQELVRLQPKMIAAIEADLSHPDDNVRQKAYTLLARYTLGNPSIAPAPETPATTPMTVHFNMPRPGDESPRTIESTAVEVKECVECKESKDETQFVGNSDRCQDCHDALQAVVRERFGDA